MTCCNNIRLKVLQASDEIDCQALQSVLESTPNYWLIIWDELPDKNAAHETFTALPPNKTYADKFVCGIFLDNKIVGCVDLVKDWPDKGTLMLGLLLIAEKYQNQGIGKCAFSKILNFTPVWPVEKIRLGVVTTNDKALQFWLSLGFLETERKPFHEKQIATEIITLEKAN